MKKWKLSTQSDPTNPYYWNLLGDAYTLKGLFHIALTYYKKLSELNGGDKENLKKLAESSRRTGDLEEMVTYYEKAVSCPPSDLFQFDIECPHRLLALAYYHTGRYQEMIETHKKSKLQTAFPELAWAYSKLGDLSNYLATYHELILPIIIGGKRNSSQLCCEFYCHIKEYHPDTISSSSDKVKHFLNAFDRDEHALLIACRHQMCGEIEQALNEFRILEQKHLLTLNSLRNDNPSLQEGLRFRNNFESIMGTIPYLDPIIHQSLWFLDDEYANMIRLQQFLLRHQAEIYLLKESYSAASDSIKKALELNPFDFACLELKKKIHENENSFRQKIRSCSGTDIIFIHA